MGEKGNGGHVATGGARAVRTAADPSAMGMGGTSMTDAASAGGGGGGLGDVVGDVGDHATDIGGAAFGRREHGSDDD